MMKPHAAALRQHRPIDLVRAARRCDQLDLDRPDEGQRDHQILARLLNNLKAIYLQRRDYNRAVVVVDRLLLVHPDAVWELKERGLLYYRLGAFLPALSDLRSFLRHDPDAEDVPLVRYYADLCHRLLMIAN